MSDHRYSASSERRLATCDDRLRRVLYHVLPQFDHAILCGARTKEEQYRAFQAGLSHTSWPNSNHNTRPLEPLTQAEWELPIVSRAVDVFPKPEKGWSHWDWDDTPRFHFFAGLVLATAEAMKIPIRWGGNWDGDHQFRDQRLFDLVHFEIKETP